LAHMNRFILFFALATACSPNNDGALETTDTGNPVDDTEDTDTEDTDTEDTDTEDTDTDDTVPPSIILEEGTWSLASAILVSDSCGVDKYQDVKKFVPPEIMITDSSEASFKIDAGTVCTRNNLDYTCSGQDVSESALGGTAELQINSVMSGEIVDESDIDITFDVTIESCKGVGCIAIQAVLKFPCPVTLNTQANAR
jgi:hypothetical protein